MSAFDCDVIIAGYGPSGVTAANFLGMNGISTIAIERDTDIYPRARAVTVDEFTLRLMQQAGLDGQLLKNMETRTILRWKTYAGKEFLRIEPVDNGYGQPAGTQIFQPVMEQSMRDGAARFPETVTVRYGSEVLDVTQDADSVTATVKDLATGVTSTVRGRYLLAADGGSSVIRETLGVKLRGRSKSRRWIIVDAKVIKWWPGCDVLTFWSDPDRPVVDIPLALGHHRWEIPLGPADKKEDFENDDAIWRLLTPLGVTPDNIQILHHAFYTHNVLMAENWRVGRILLAGDSGHMMPPWAGQGMQSGIRDAHNAAWKLTLVLTGKADSSLLDTYQAEREPHVAEMTRLAELLGTFIEEADPRKVKLRNTLLPVAQRVPGLGPFIQEFRFKAKPALTAGLLAAAPAKKNAVGRMIPQPVVARLDGSEVRLDDVLAPGFAVVGIGVDPDAVLTPEQRAGWEAVGARFVTVLPADGRPQLADEVVDFRGVLIKWAQRFHAKVLVVRPDKFVYGTDRESLDVPAQLRPRVTAQVH